MNSDTLKGQWKQLRGKAKERWGKLTDDELDQIDGQTDQLVGRVQERYGVAREEAQKQVDDWQRQANA
ncbi:MAG: CsbD family protein [Vicinamibacterales bacterium]